MGTAPRPVTVYIRGPIKGKIEPDYTYYPTLTEWGQYPRFRFQGIFIYLFIWFRLWCYSLLNLWISSQERGIGSQLASSLRRFWQPQAQTWAASCDDYEVSIWRAGLPKLSCCGGGFARHKPYSLLYTPYPTPTPNPNPNLT